MLRMRAHSGGATGAREERAQVGAGGKGGVEGVGRGQEAGRGDAGERGGVEAH